ncbi:MAG: hypothetical protein CMM56_09595 [Rhodospirillaceae bacterium]|nr:hypothetical protein [Rhodospirillaceae bacterium]
MNQQLEQLMKHFSVPIFPWGKKPPTLEELISQTKHAETLGFYSVNTPLINTLHARSGGGFARFGNHYVLDALSVLPILVTHTNRIRVAVDGVPLFQLPPFGWAKYFSSLDVLSNGRTIMGACLGFGEEAFQTVGLHQRHRGRIADEQLNAITRLWTEDLVTHQGEFFEFREVTVDPKPIQTPHIPIWLAGREPSIPRAARYAEVIDPPWPTLYEVKEVYLPKLRSESKKWDRIPPKLGGWFYSKITDDAMSDIDITNWFEGLMNQEFDVSPADISFAGSPAQCATKIRQYLDAGVEHFVLDFQRHGLETVDAAQEQMTRFVEQVVPLL